MNREKSDAKLSVTDRSSSLNYVCTHSLITFDQKNAMYEIQIIITVIFTIIKTVLSSNVRL
jgi:hypothetical protein